MDNDENACRECSDENFDAQAWNDEMMKKHGWVVHYVPGEDDWSPTGVNIHTHGVFESFDHLDFQIVIPLPQEIAHPILADLVKAVKGGETFEEGKRYPEILVGFDVMFLRTVEGPNQVLRLILPDTKGNLYQGTFENPGYEDQYIHVPELPSSGSASNN